MEARAEQWRGESGCLARVAAGRGGRAGEEQPEIWQAVGLWDCGPGDGVVWSPSLGRGVSPSWTPRLGFSGSAGRSVDQAGSEIPNLPRSEGGS